MLFNSLNFIVFFVAVVVIYYLLPKNSWRKVFLLGSSYYFYACFNVAMLSVLLFETALAYSFGLSKMNTKTIKCNYLPEPEDRGYEAVKGKLPDDIQFEEKPSTITAVEPLKVEYMQKFIDLCKGNNIPLLLVYSPIFRNGESPAMKKIAEMAKASGAPFWDYSNEPTIIKRENFRDAMHLHDEGAHVWSEFLANKIKEKYGKR